MPNRRILLSANNYYHIYNRGVNKELIFFSQRNYQYFLYKMAQYFLGKADIITYCLMPNHFHLVVKVIDDAFVEKSLTPLL